MFAILSLFTLICALAGRVLAFNITVGTQNLTLTQMLDIPQSPVTNSCNSQCSDTKSKISACNDDASCLCKIETVTSLQNCEICMFHFLIHQNEKAPDFRAGSNPVMGAYAASCASANQTVPAALSALTLPSDWDGPFDAILPLGGTVVTVMVGSILGISALLLLSNM